MANKINLSFKDTKEENELLEFIYERSKIIGNSAFIKQVIYEYMLRIKATEK